MISMSYHLFISSVTMNNSREHEATQRERGQAPEVPRWPEMSMLGVFV